MHPELGKGIWIPWYTMVTIPEGTDDFLPLAYHGTTDPFQVGIWPTRRQEESHNVKTSRNTKFPI